MTLALADRFETVLGARRGAANTLRHDPRTDAAAAAWQRAAGPYRELAAALTQARGAVHDRLLATATTNRDEVDSRVEERERLATLAADVARLYWAHAPDPAAGPLPPPAKAEAYTRQSYAEAVDNARHGNPGKYTLTPFTYPAELPPRN